MAAAAAGVRPAMSSAGYCAALMPYLVPLSEPRPMRPPVQLPASSGSHWKPPSCSSTRAIASWKSAPCAASSLGCAASVMSVRSDEVEDSVRERAHEARQAGDREQHPPAAPRLAH